MFRLIVPSAGMCIYKGEWGFFKGYDDMTGGNVICHKDGDITKQIYSPLIFVNAHT